MKRFVKLKVPANNPECGALLEHDPPEPRHPERIVFAEYDDAARRGYGPYGTNPNPETLRPEVKYYHNNISVWHLGEGYDPTCMLAIDARELIENDKGGFSWGGPGDSYRVSSWASRLVALHIKD